MLPRVAVLSTGDELAKPGTGLLSGQIYNSNGPMLHAMLLGLGITSVTVAHCSDDYTDTEQTLARLIAANDFIIIAGGVSVGEHDQIKPALQRLGLEPDLWRVKMKPGKPFLFSHRDGKAAESDRPDRLKAGLQRSHPLYVFGLPGNPVSSFVTFHLFVRPALLKWLGASDAETTAQTSLAEVTEAVSNRGDRPHFVRGRLADGKFTPLGVQQSHAIFGLSNANALLRLDADESLPTGSVRQVIVV